MWDFSLKNSANKSDLISNMSFDFFQANLLRDEQDELGFCENPEDS